MVFKFFVLWIIALGGCFSRNAESIKKTKVNSIEDQSWFKKGVDRFYLAHGDGNEIIDGGPEKQGWDILVGLGCYGEDKNRDAEVKVPGPGGELKKLSERSLITDFPLAIDRDRPANGECVVLLGNRYESAVFKKELDPNALENAKLNIVGSSFSCLGLAAASLTLALTYTAFAPVAIANTTVIAAAASSGLGLSAVAALAPELWLSVASSSFGCVTGTKSAFEAVSAYQRDENKKLFFMTFAQAETSAKKTMQGEKILELSDETQLERFLRLEKVAASKGGGVQFLKAVALFNPYLVRAFNRDVHAKMEQGWFKQSKFFDAIETIATEMGQNSSRVQ